MKIRGLFFGLVIIIVLIITSNGKRLSKEDDDDLESLDLDARSFLKKQDDKNFDKWPNNLDCIPCKFNMVPCCKPNLCIKKRFRPDECLELKPR